MKLLFEPNENCVVIKLDLGQIVQESFKDELDFILEQLFDIQENKASNEKVANPFYNSSRISKGQTLNLIEYYPNSKHAFRDLIGRLISYMIESNIVLYGYQTVLKEMLDLSGTYQLVKD